MTKPKKELQIEPPSELIIELLTPSEVRMVKQRLYIIRLYKEGKSVRTIAKEAGVGTDTVIRMKRKIESSAKLKKHFSIKVEKDQPALKWVIGQGSEEIQ
jgi:uncharacterized protein YerC